MRVVPHVWPAEPTVERDLACAERVVAPNKIRTSLGKGVNEPAGASRAGCKGSASTSIHCSFSTTQRRRHVAVRRRPASFNFRDSLTHCQSHSHSQSGRPNHTSVSLTNRTSDTILLTNRTSDTILLREPCRRGGVGRNANVLHHLEGQAEGAPALNAATGSVLTLRKLWRWTSRSLCRMLDMSPRLDTFPRQWRA